MVMLKNFIAGEWSAPSRELDADLCNASTGKAMLRQVAAGEEQIEAALACAAEVHASGDWANVYADSRADLLDKIADVLQNRSEEIAEADSQCTGVILKFTRTVAGICPAAFRAAATMLRQAKPEDALPGPHGDVLVERLPLGPAAVIAPWNAPSGIACHKLASALAAGCPVIIKPSEWAPLSGQLIAEACEIAGVPKGVVQLLHGDAKTGAALVSDTRIAAVSFTGGLQGGRAVARACAEHIKPAQLELGGNNALIVLDDANLEAAANSVLTALTTLNGQWCRALGRLIVHQSVEPKLLEIVSKKLDDVILGDASDESSNMGPLVHAGHLQHVRDAVANYVSEGGSLLQPTPVPESEGYYYPPTLILGLRGDQALEEIFGPVATVHSFSSDEEAIALANQTPFGLAGYVFGQEDHAWQIAKKMRTGIVKINEVTMLNLHPLAPRPAWGLSGLGDEGVVETYEFFRGTRVIGVAARPEGSVDAS